MRVIKIFYINQPLRFTHGHIIFIGFVNLSVSHKPADRQAGNLIILVGMQKINFVYAHFIELLSSNI